MQLTLHVGKERGTLSGLLHGDIFFALLLPGCSDNFFFAFGDFLLLVPCAAPATTSAACLLGLGELSLKRIGLHEKHVAASFGVGVLSGSVKAQQVAGHQLEIFKADDGGSVRFFTVFLLEQRHGLLGAAIHGVMQRHVLQAEFISGVDGDSDLLDGAGAIIFSGALDAHVGRIGFAGLDEIVLGEAHGLALIQGGDVVEAILLNLYGALVDVTFTAGKIELLVIVQDQHAIAQRPVSHDFELSLGALDGAQITAALFDGIRHAHPGRELVGHANLLNSRQVGDLNIEVRRPQRTSFDVVFDALRDSREDELISGRARRAAA